MFRLSKQIEKLEDYAEKRWGAWFERHKEKVSLYIPLGLTAWYFYGMFLNSLKLGTAVTFCKPGETPPESIWVLNPFKNWLPLFLPGESPGGERGSEQAL